MKEKVTLPGPVARTAHWPFPCCSVMRYEAVALLSAVTSDRKVSTPAVGVDLLGLQADSAGLPLAKVVVPDEPKDEAYERAMKQTLVGYREQGGGDRSGIR